MRTFWALAAVASMAVTAHAQSPLVVSRDGWEAFPWVEYQGGDATQPTKRRGMLVLTDSTLSLHKCRFEYCDDHRKHTELPFEEKPLYTIQLRSIKEVTSSSQVRGPSAGSRLALGLLAGDRTEEMVGIVYESASSAEAPVFKTQKAQSAAVEAKLRFRLKKIGVTLSPGS